MRGTSGYRWICKSPPTPQSLIVQFRRSGGGETIESSLMQLSSPGATLSAQGQERQPSNTQLSHQRHQRPPACGRFLFHVLARVGCPCRRSVRASPDDLVDLGNHEAAIVHPASRSDRGQESTFFSYSFTNPKGERISRERRATRPIPSSGRGRTQYCAWFIPARRVLMAAFKRRGFGSATRCSGLPRKQRAVGAPVVRNSTLQTMSDRFELRSAK